MSDYQGATMPREMNSMAIAAFVLALVGLCNPLGLLGLIFGYVAKRQIRTRNNAGSGLATAGIVLGWISLIGFILLIVLLIAGVFGSMAEADYWQNR